MAVKKKKVSGTPVASARKKAPAKKPASAKKTAAKVSTRKSSTSPGVTPEERWHMIAVAAYYRAEKRGFVGGNPADDWMHAEEEIDAMLSEKI